MATVAASPRVVEVPGSMNPGLVNPSVTHILDLDSFPVGTVVRAIRYSEMIAFAVVYGLYFLLLLFRLICHTRPRHTHRRGAYVCFVFMAISRTTMFAMGASLMNRIQTGVSPNWKLVLGMDLLSIIGYAVFAGGIYSLSYSWSGHIPCLYCMVQPNPTPHPHTIKAIMVYAMPLVCAIPSIAGSIVRVVAASPTAGTPNPSKWHTGKMLGRAGNITSLVFAISLLFVLCSTAYFRYNSMRQNKEVDHTAVADMIRNHDLEEATTLTTARPFLLLFLMGSCLTPGGAWRMIVVETSKLDYPPKHTWARTAAGFGVLTVLFELLALTCACGFDFEELDTGNVDFWKPWICKRRWGERWNGNGAAADDSRASSADPQSTVDLKDMPPTSPVSTTQSPSQSPPEKMFDSTVDLFHNNRNSNYSNRYSNRYSIGRAY